MLGLPKSTEMKKQLPKNLIFTKFSLNTAAKERFDADIKRIAIVNEVSTTSTAIAKGDTVNSFFIILVSLKQEKFDERNIGLISRLINQNLLFVLEYEGKAKLAVYHSKLISGEWKPSDELSVQLKGLNLDAVWENIIVQVGAIQIEQGNTLDEQIQTDEQRKKLLKQIEMLENKARAEKQPKRKFELVQQINTLEIELKAGDRI